MPPRFGRGAGPRQSNASNASTPGPDPNEPQLVDRLNYADTPRPFKNPSFASKLPARTASSAAATTSFKKNVKQILTLERERVGGGDGFLSAAQTAAKARGENIEPPAKKKKKENPVGKPKALKGGRRSGVATPMTLDEESGVSGTATPMGDGEEGAEGEGGDGAAGAGEGAAMDVDAEPVVHREIITYHTPAAPPSLLPPKKYCDITGLHAAYTDPRTKLRYKGLEVWGIVRNLGPGVDQAYLALRGAQTSLK